MADLNSQSFVKWIVAGGSAFGKIASILEDKNAVVETPSGGLMTVATKDLIQITEAEYEDNIEELVSNIGKKSKKNKKNKQEGENMPKEQVVKASETEAMVDVKSSSEAEYKSKYEEAMKNYDEATKKYEEAMKKLESEAAMRKEAEAKMQESEAKYKDAEAKLMNMEKASIAQSRFDKLKSVDAVDAIDSDPAKAKEVLSEMSDSSFATIFNIASAQFKKITTITQSNFPKSTDQTNSNFPKSTESTKASVDEVVKASESALNSTEKEVENDLSTITPVNTVAQVLSKFAEASLKSVKKNKK